MRARAPSCLTGRGTPLRSTTSWWLRRPWGSPGKTGKGAAGMGARDAGTARWGARGHSPHVTARGLRPQARDACPAPRATVPPEGRDPRRPGPQPPAPLPTARLHAALTPGGLAAEVVPSLAPTGSPRVLSPELPPPSGGGTDRRLEGRRPHPCGGAAGGAGTAALRGVSRWGAWL